jgi:hypothetical protein
MGADSPVAQPVWQLKGEEGGSRQENERRRPKEVHKRVIRVKLSFGPSFLGETPRPPDPRARSNLHPPRTVDFTANSSRIELC